MGDAGTGILNIDYLKFALVLTAGTSLLLWIGDQITAKGIGNGISLIIMAGIISSMPTMFATAFTELTSTNTFTGVLLLFYMLLFI